MQELNSSNGVVANLLTGLGIDESFTRTASSTTSTFLADALGSPLGLVTANNGPIATNYTYQPFGATTVGGSANGNSYEFTGRENDGTGLYYCCARPRCHDHVANRVVVLTEPIRGTMIVGACSRRDEFADESTPVRFRRARHCSQLIACVRRRRA